MPLKLIPPRQGRSPNWTIRGTYIGVYVDQSTGTHREAVARQALRKLEKRIERGEFVTHRGAPTFGSAALSYTDAGGEEKFLGPLLRRWQTKPLAEIDQAEIDRAAAELHPGCTAATRNRCVYTPVSAVLRHAGVAIVLRRPKGADGERRTDFLTPEQAAAVLAACDDDHEYRAFLTLLLYTGMRLGEALSLTCDKVSLSDATAFLGRTKNDHPRLVHLPPVVVAALGNLPAGLGRGAERVFPRYGKTTEFGNKLRRVFSAAGAPLAEGQAYHIFRHTYGTWMRMYAGLTREGLVETGAWRSATAAGRYDHADKSAAARAADLLPTRRKA